MKRKALISVAVLISATVSAQEVTDAFRYSKTDIVGTARYMSMAGAYGALGGDITTLSNNPAGIGIYRSSEVVTTLSIGGVNTSSSLPANRFKIEGTNYNNSKFNIACNNLGYVGTFKTGKRNGLVNFNVGFSFNRLGGEKRNYKVTQDYMQGSLSRYIAAKASAWGGNSNTLVASNGSNYDPYYETNAPWLAIMAYNTGIIDGTGNNYQGLYANDADVFNAGDLKVEESSRIDEYSFNVGGNISNMVYWGLGIGVEDLNYTTRTYYDDVYFTNNNSETLTQMQLDNYLNTTATGINVKGGLIIRPINSWRLGVAVHTPTWYQLSDRYNAQMTAINPQSYANYETMLSPDEVFDYRLRTPWKFQFSTALIFKKYGLLSLEYEIVDYSQMTFNDNDGFEGNFSGVNGDISSLMTTMNTLKIGSEIRLIPPVIFRLGYAYQSSGYGKDVRDNSVQMYTAGTLPNYNVNLSTNYFTGGLGYRINDFFMDMAFVYKMNKQDAYLFPKLFEGNTLNSIPSELKTDSYNFLVTLGYKF